jgi:hypothetical protein
MMYVITTAPHLLKSVYSHAFGCDDGFTEDDRVDSMAVLFLELSVLVCSRWAFRVCEPTFCISSH